MAVIYVNSFDWFVFDVVDAPATIPGTAPRFICGRASVDTQADLITVSMAGGSRASTQITGAEMQCLARQLLRELQDTQVRS